MPIKDPETRRAYQLEWLRRRREEWIDSQGRVCVKCGRSDLPFEIDHVDPSTKVNHRVWSWSAGRREEELAKCQLLCEECHWEKTGKENSGLVFVHGTVTAYRYGCRCPDCRAAKSEENAKRYAGVV